MPPCLTALLSACISAPVTCISGELFELGSAIFGEGVAGAALVAVVAEIVIGDGCCGFGFGLERVEEDGMAWRADGVEVLRDGYCCTSDLLFT